MFVFRCLRVPERVGHVPDFLGHSLVFSHLSSSENWDTVAWPVCVARDSQTLARRHVPVNVLFATKIDFYNAAVTLAVYENAFLESQTACGRASQHSASAR